MVKIAVAAFGGNALLKKGEKGIEQQFKNVKRAVKVACALIKRGYAVCITHGNGPQIGNIALRSELAKSKAYEIPLDVAGAQSQGEIGYVIEQSLINQIKKEGLGSKTCCMLTQVAVDARDRSFANPAKPIGPFYAKPKAVMLKRKGWNVAEDARGGYRRVVPSPKPVRIVEIDVIKKLLKERVVVIACGGGGIPVINKRGRIVGVEGVIDKDLASALLAADIGAELFIDLTDVRGVALNYGKKNQKFLSRMSAKDAKKWLNEGQFAKGSMGPKIEAAINYLNKIDGKVIITSSKYALRAVSGRAGTVITR